MALTEYGTQLSLAEWAKLMGINPLHIFGIVLPEVPNQCSGAWAKYDWQNSDAISRVQLSQIIADAENTIESFVGYHLTPQWDTGKRFVLAKPVMPETVWLSAVNKSGYPHAMQLPFGKFKAGGIRATTLIGEDAAIVWDAAGEYNWKKQGTVTVVSALTDMSEIHVYYPNKDPLPENEIRPIVATASGGTITITFNRELCVKSEIEDEMVFEVIDGTEDANFLSAVDVYRVYNDNTNHGIAIWENIGTCSCTVDSGCSMCQYGYQNICLTARDYEGGKVAYHAASYNEVDSQWDAVGWAVNRMPDMLQPSWYSGQDSMNVFMKKTIAIYAASKLDRPPCGCAAPSIEQWQADLAYQSGAKELAVYRIGDSEYSNPFGTQRGALEAWRRIVQIPRVSNGRVGVVIA